MISYEKRKEIVNVIIEKYRKYTPNIDDKQRYYILFGVHFVLSCITLLYLIDNKRIREIVILLGIFTVFTQTIFNGCLISRIETKLYPDGYSILDPYMKVLNIEITNRNRKKFTRIFGIILLSGMIGYYIYRYYLKN